jgi:hypothetical protein
VHVSAVVSGSAEGGATLPVGEFVSISLCDVVEAEIQEFARTAAYRRTYVEFGGHVVTVDLRVETLSGAAPGPSR